MPEAQPIPVAQIRPRVPPLPFGDASFHRARSNRRNPHPGGVASVPPAGANYVSSRNRSIPLPRNACLLLRSSTSYLLARRTCVWCQCGEEVSRGSVYVQVAERRRFLRRCPIHSRMQLICLTKLAARARRCSRRSTILWRTSSFAMTVSVAPGSILGPIKMMDIPGACS